MILVLGLDQYGTSIRVRTSMVPVLGLDQYGTSVRVGPV